MNNNTTNIRLVIGPNRLPIDIIISAPPSITVKEIQQAIQPVLKETVAKPGGFTKRDLLDQLTITCEANNWSWTMPKPDLTLYLCHTS